MELSMTIKNTIMVLTITACAIPTPTQCMVNAAKMVLNCFGTVIGLSPALVIIVGQAYIRYKSMDDPIQLIENIKKIKTREPSADEETFLRPHVGKNTVLRIALNKGKNDDSYMTTPSRNMLLAPEILLGTNLTVAQFATWEKTGKNALFSNNTSVADAYIAGIQHEVGHIKNNDSATISAFAISTAIVTTGVSAKVFQKLFPKNINATISKVAIRSLAKSVGGYILLLANVKLISLYIKQCEYAADLHVEVSKREAMFTYLEDVNSDATQNSRRSIKQSIYNWLPDTHPTTEQRKQHLLQQSTKQKASE
jgi:hypothetical protein